MRKLLLFIFSISLVCLIQCGKVPVPKPKQKTTLELMEGKWVHSEDSLATVIVKNGKWTFNYDGQKVSNEDEYNMIITAQLPEFADKTKKGQFLILQNRNDTLKYEIWGITDSIMSLFYFPNHKHLYRRK